MRKKSNRDHKTVINILVSYAINIQPTFYTALIGI